MFFVAYSKIPMRRTYFNVENLRELSFPYSEFIFPRKEKVIAKILLTDSRD